LFLIQSIYVNAFFRAAVISIEQNIIETWGCEHPVSHPTTTENTIATPWQPPAITHILV